MKTFRVVLLLVAGAFVCGCSLVGVGVDLASDAWRDNVGSTSWAYGAELGQGRLCSVEERTPATGMLNAKFRDSIPCWTVSYDERLSDGGVVRCQAILPINWNGKLWLVANDSPDGELPGCAVSFAQDGSAVVCGDGGMGQVLRRNGRVNAIAAGARSPSLRKEFFQEALALVLEGGKILVARKYGRAPDEILCYGRESGGAQALFLVASAPTAVDSLVLVNPAVDFAVCAAYDLTIARQTGSAHLLRPTQFAHLQSAAKDLKLESFVDDRASELWSAAGRYDDSFSYNPTYAPRICDAWRTLLAGGALGSGTNAVAIPPVRLDMNFEARMRERPWRIAWLFGESASGVDVQDADFFARLPEMALYSPPTDLSAFTDAGGKVELVLEAANARVPESVAKPLTSFVEPVRTSLRIPRP